MNILLSFSSKPFFIFSFKWSFSKQSDWDNSNSNWIDDFTDTTVRRREKKKRNEPFISFKIYFSFLICFLVWFFKTIWMEQFQLKLDWWIHWEDCKKIKKRNKRKKKWKFKKKYFSLFFLFHFNLVIFLKTIWMEQFQLKLDWWIHCKICKKIKKRKKWKRNENL